jgi:glycerol kinase
VLGVRVRRAAIQETTALGAAYLAGIGVGIWSGTAELAERWRSEREFSPGDTVAAEDRYRVWRRAVDRSLRWASEGDMGLGRK